MEALSRPTGSKHTDKFIATQLREGERVVIWSICYLGADFDGVFDALTKRGVVLVTNLRVVFFRQGVFGQRCESMPIKKISSVEKKFILGRGIVSFYTSATTLILNISSTKGANNILETVAYFREAGEQDMRGRVQDVGEAKPESSSLNSLKELERLRNEGMISEEEFSSKRTEILTRL